MFAFDVGLYIRVLQPKQLHYTYHNMSYVWYNYILHIITINHLALILNLPIENKKIINNTVNALAVGRRHCSCYLNMKIK